MVGISGWDEMSKQEQDLLLDLGQLALDIIGIVEPTPFADSASALISITRRDWWGALISGVSIIPYVGDLAKLGKISRYSASLEQAIRLARTGGGKFAAAVKAVTARILAAIRKLPVDQLPKSVRDGLEKLHRLIADFHGGGMRLSKMDKLTDETLIHVFGSTKNVGILPRQNVKTIVEFFSKHKVNGGPAEWSELIKGIDLHAAKPVEVVRMSSGQKFAQYSEVSRGAKNIGSWMVKVQGGVSHRNLGLSGAGRERQLVQLKSGVEMLKSKAATAADHWTDTGSKAHTAVTRNSDGKRVMKRAEQVAGGGEQFFLPDAWKYLKKVP